MRDGMPFDPIQGQGQGQGHAVVCDLLKRFYAGSYEESTVSAAQG